MQNDQTNTPQQQTTPPPVVQAPQPTPAVDQGSAQQVQHAPPSPSGDNNGTTKVAGWITLVLGGFLLVLGLLGMVMSPSLYSLLVLILATYWLVSGSKIAKKLDAQKMHGVAISAIVSVFLVAVLALFFGFPGGLMVLFLPFAIYSSIISSKLNKKPQQ